MTTTPHRRQHFPAPVTEPDGDRHPDHVLGATTLVALALVAAGNVWDPGRWWSSLDCVRKYPWLR